MRITRINKRFIEVELELLKYLNNWHKKRVQNALFKYI